MEFFTEFFNKLITVEVSKYCSELYGVNKLTTNVIFDSADTFYLPDMETAIMLCVNGRGARGQEKITKSNLSKRLFLKVKKLVLNNRFTGRRLKFIFKRFPELTHVHMYKNDQKEYIKYFPPTVQRVTGVPIWLKYHSIFPKNMTEISLSVCERLFKNRDIYNALRTIPKRIRVNLSVRIGDLSKMNLNNVSSLRCDEVDTDLNHTNIQSICTIYMYDLSLLPITLVSLQANVCDISGDISRLKSLTTLSVTQIHPTAVLPTSLTDLIVLQCQDVDFSYLSLYKFRSESIDSTMKLPETLVLIITESITCLPQSPNLRHLIADDFNNVSNLSVLSSYTKLDLFAIESRLTRHISYQLPHNIFEMNCHSIDCSRLYRENLKDIFIYEESNVMFATKIVSNGDLLSLEDAGVRVHLKSKKTKK